MFKKVLFLFLISFLLFPVVLAADPFHGSYGDDEELPIVNGEGGVWNLVKGGVSGDGGLNVIGGVVYEHEDEFEPLPMTIYRIIRTSLQLLGVIFVVLIVYAGFLWMTAGGNEEQITKAKNFIKNATIGLLIVLSAYAISLFVFGAIVGDNFQPEYDQEQT